MDINKKEKSAARIAKLLTLICFRNPLENIHAGICPETKVGDYSDVKIIDAYGQEIPWNKVSRISDEEMKELMIEVVNLVYTFMIKQSDPEFYSNVNQFYGATSKWNRPEIDKNFIDVIK